MSKAITKEDMTLLEEAGEMFNETGCVPGIDGEQVPAERMVPDAKEYILESIDDPEAVYDSEIWGAIQSDALTLRICVIRLVGSDLRASRFCRTWPNRPPNRRFYG